jgi:hypothetical protein
MEFLKKAAAKPKAKNTVDGILPVHDEGMKDVPVEKLHKLRLVLRNERLTWVEEFLQLGGFEAVVKVLRRCMDIEWRFVCSNRYFVPELIFETGRSMKILSCMRPYFV